MKRLKDIPKLNRLAKKRGTPLRSVDFQGRSVSFSYIHSTGIKTIWYKDVDRGIREELRRLL